MKMMVQKRYVSLQNTSFQHFMMIVQGTLAEAKVLFLYTHTQRAPHLFHASRPTSICLPTTTCSLLTIRETSQASQKKRGANLKALRLDDMIPCYSNAAHAREQPHSERLENPY